MLALSTFENHYLQGKLTVGNPFLDSDVVLKSGINFSFSGWQGVYTQVLWCQK